jgi:hypothetical protein
MAIDLAVQLLLEHHWLLCATLSFAASTTPSFRCRLIQAGPPVGRVQLAG